MAESSAGLLLALLLFLAPGALTAQEMLVFPGANSRETYFSMHNLGAAHELATGRGVKVGVMDHTFGVDVHPDLYAGGKTFQAERYAEGYRTGSSHGYLMALVLREVAPGVEIYALGTSDFDDEGAKVDAMVRAIDWAIANGIRVLTYSDRRFSPDVRPRLDSAVARAHDAGIVTTFIHYPHPGNLLPSWIGPRSGDDERDPDLNIFHYDYTSISYKRVRRWQSGETTRIGDHPFLSLSSTSPVTAGMVALLLEVDPSLSPEDCRRILMEASRPVTFEKMTGPRVPDALRAVQHAADATRRQGP